MNYLAGPYTHKREDVRHLRYLILSQISHFLLDEGTFVFSPITHGHAIEMSKGGKPIDYTRWIIHGLDMLSKCEIMYVAQIPGWEESKGVQMELDFARLNNMLIQKISYDNIRELNAVDDNLLQDYDMVMEEVLNEQ